MGIIRRVGRNSSIFLRDVRAFLRGCTLLGHQAHITNGRQSVENLRRGRPEASLSRLVLFAAHQLVRPSAQADPVLWLALRGDVKFGLSLTRVAK